MVLHMYSHLSHQHVVLYITLDILGLKNCQKNFIIMTMMDHAGAWLQS